MLHFGFVCVDGRFGLTLIVYSINVFDSFYDAVATDVAAEPAVLLKRVGKPARTWRDCVELMTAALFTNGCVNSCSAVALVAGLMRKHCGSTNIHESSQSHTAMPPSSHTHATRTKLRKSLAVSDRVSGTLGAFPLVAM